MIKKVKERKLSFTFSMKIMLSKIVRNYLITTCLCVSLFCFGVYCFFSSKAKDIRKIPVSFTEFIDQPLITASLEDQRVALLVDIGSCCDLGLQSPVINRITNKDFIETQELKDAKGDVYTLRTFSIPFLCIEGEKYEQLLAYEEDMHYSLNMGLLWDNSSSKNRREKQAKVIHGKIGRSFFSKWTCLFDFPASRLILAKTVAPLLNYCASKQFTQIPFVLNKYGISIFLETNLGIKEFYLDTGANASLFRRSQIDLSDAQEIYPDCWNYSMKSLRLGPKELGSWSFWLYEFCPELQFDGILGIDFFQAHSMIIDFEHSVLYLD